MSSYSAIIEWARNTQPFTDNRYSRAHTWTFDGGITVAASSSPQVVRVPFSNPANVDPEEAFVAALSSCHMLTFLSLAARVGYRVDRYRDDAVAHMARNSAGKQWISHVQLRPHVIFSGTRLPDPPAVDAMHHEAHGECFLANSVRTEITVHSSLEFAGT